MYIALEMIQRFHKHGINDARDLRGSVERIHNKEEEHHIPKTTHQYRILSDR